MTATFTTSETLGRVCGTFNGWNVIEIHLMGSLDFRSDFAETDVFDFFVRTKLFKRRHCSIDHSQVVIRTERLGKNVFNTDRFEHCAAAAPSDDTRSVRRRT